MHTLPMTRGTLGPCAHLTTLSYGADPMFTTYLRPHSSRSLPSHWTHVFASRLKLFYTLPDQALRVMISDDSDAFYSTDTGPEVIGYAAWHRERGSLSTSTDTLSGKVWDWSRASRWIALEGWLLGWEGWYDRWLKADRAYDYEALGTFIRAVRGVQGLLKEMMGGVSPERGYVYVEEVHCAPRFQRKGVGRRLVQQGLDQARAENVPVCLIASESGERLYEKMGFRRVGMGYFGKYESPAMVWYPPGWKVVEVEHFVFDANQAG